MKNEEIRTLKKELIKYFGRILISVILLLVIIIGCVCGIGKANQAINEQVNCSSQLHKAETAHYKWSNNLLLSLNYGQEFTGSDDPTACAFGKFIYGEEWKNDADFQKFVQEVEPFHNQIHASAGEIFGLGENDSEGKKKIFLDTTMPAIEKLVQRLDAEIADRSERIEKKQKEFYGLLAVCGIVCFLDVLVVAWCIGMLYRFLSNEITVNLKKIVRGTVELSKGRLNVAFAASGTVKEIVDLRESLNASIEELGKYIYAINRGMNEFAKGNLAANSTVKFIGDFEQIERSITTFAEKISAILWEVENVAGSVAASSEHISNSVQDLAAGAMEQADSVKTLSEKTADMAGSIQVIARNMSEINEIVSTTSQDMMGEKDKMQEMSGAMDQISVRAEEIKDIVSTMDDIAAQTNLLALNATIEASRAGSAGAGFGVVASEIQALAQHSAEASRNISELIADTIEAVDLGNQKVEESVATLDEIIGATLRISDKVEVVSKNTQEESDMMAQIKKEVDHVSDMVVANSASTEANASASQELAAQAELLKELTAQFQIRKK